MVAPVIPDQVGPVYDAGIISPTHGSLGLVLRPSSYHKDLQSQLRDEVVGALSIAIGDRDLAFWKRSSQNDWSKGEGQDYYSDSSRYDTSRSIDVHRPGELRLVPQPALIRAATATLNGRGAVYCRQKAFFPWIDGFYTFVDNTLTSNLATTPAGAHIGDIAADGTNVFFALYSTVNIYTTTGAAPGALVAYDASGSSYGRLAYDQAAKILYAATSPFTGLARIDKINAGGAATAIYDFVTGRVDAIEMHQGDLIIGWNDASASIGSTGFIGKARLFAWSGTALSTLADLPDGTMVVGLKSVSGILLVMCEEQDPLDSQNSPPASVRSLFIVAGGTITRIGKLYGTTASDSVSNTVYLGSSTMAVAVGSSVFIPAQGFCDRYDLDLGGLSTSLGDDGVPASAGFISAIMTGLVLMSGGGLLVEYGGGLATGGVYNLNGTINGIVPSTNAPFAGKLISSRMDAGLPYVNKFWYDIQVVCDPLTTGDQIGMEYSLDDGMTWTTCPNSPYATVAGTGISFLVQQPNPHVRYRVHLVAASSKGPYIHSISPRYVVINPEASVYRMVVACADNTRARNNEVQEDYAKDALAFLDNVARTSETITFYEPNDSTRTPRTCWVMQMSRAVSNTSGEYSPDRSEGDVELVLWETGTS